MGFSVDFYSFSKKENSTKRPTGSGTLLTTCVLKDSCGILNPVIEINSSDAGNPASYNYAYILQFSAYYYVDEWTYYRGTWTATMHMDVLATYKTEIGASTQYVLRAADSTAWNGDIIDTYYPTKGAVTVNNNSTSGMFGGGTYVMGIYGRGSSVTRGPVTYYAFDDSQLQNFVSFILGDTFAGRVLTSVEKALFNPLQYIASVQWYPFAAPTGGNVAIKFGWWELNSTGDPAASALSTISQGPLYYTVTVPKHPQKATRGNYLQFAPYSRYELDAGPFGIIPLDSADLYNVTTLNILLSEINYSTGMARLTVKDSSDILAQRIAKVSVDVPMAQITNDYVGAGVSIAQAAISTIAKASTGDIGGAIGSAVSGVASAAESLLPQLASTGAWGSPTALYNPVLISRFQNIVDANDDHAGRPVCDEKVLNTLSGYILCADGEFDISCPASVRTQIKNYLTTGFFYE